VRWIASALLFLTLGCAGPIHELWPPAPGASTHEIIVSLDDWHAMVAIPHEKNQTGEKARYEEWGYAELEWYVKDRRGIFGVLRVLFWLPDGVVEVGLHDRVWAERSPKPPTDSFRFRISNEGLHNLRRHLQNTIASRKAIHVHDDGSRFYPASDSYNLLFHQCHQYAAAALREAGLPVSPRLAVSRTAFAAQLRRAVLMAEEGE